MVSGAQPALSMALRAFLRRTTVAAESRADCTTTVSMVAAPLCRPLQGGDVMDGAHPTLSAALRAFLRRSPVAAGNRPDCTTTVSFVAAPLVRKIALQLLHRMRTAAMHGAVVPPSITQSSPITGPTPGTFSGRLPCLVTSNALAYGMKNFCLQSVLPANIHKAQAYGIRSFHSRPILPAKIHKAYGKRWASSNRFCFPGQGAQVKVDPFIFSVLKEFIILNWDFMKRTWGKMTQKQRVKLYMSLSMAVYTTLTSIAALFYKEYNMKILIKAKEFAATEQCRFRHIEIILDTYGKKIKALQQAFSELKMSADLGLYRFPLRSRHGAVKKDSQTEGD